VEIIGNGFQVWLASEEPWEVALDATIIVGGNSFTCTFFTLAQIQSILDRWRLSGECLGGTYFWAANMVIVRELSEFDIKLTIEDLIKTGEFKSVFSNGSS
jgi:hypothetical protein